MLESRVKDIGQSMHLQHGFAEVAASLCIINRSVMCAVAESLSIVPAAVFCSTAMARRCDGTCKSGRRCSVTSSSTMADSTGKLVAAPLLAGGSRCLFHMSTFAVESAPAENLLVVLIDLETTGLSLAGDRIVEIGALALKGGAAFATVVKPVGAQSSATSVHGIEESELEKGPLFPEAFDRLVHFLNTLSETAMASDAESSEDELPPLKARSEPPVICLAAHNGFRFDYPMLLCECLRNGISWSLMARWRYVDTLVLLRALDPEVYGSCLKLQCLARRCASDRDLRAHRALDDNVFLRDVVVNISELLDTTVVDLLRPFVVSMDWQATGTSLAVPLDL